MVDVLYDATATMLQRHLRFERGLADVAGMVSRNTVGADGVGVALTDGAEVLLRVASTTLVDTADDVQYGLGEGPCLTAVAEKRSVRTGSLRGSERRWPRFADGVRQLGIGCALSLPLVVREEVIGSLNIYSLRDDAFVEGDMASGERFARPVAAAIWRARITQHVHALAAHLHETVEAQALTSRAVGYLRHHEGLSREAARQRLVETADEQRQSVAEAATSLLQRVDRAAGKDETGTAP